MQQRREDKEFLQTIKLKLSKQAKDDTASISKMQQVDIEDQIAREKVEECSKLGKKLSITRIQKPKERIVDPSVIKRPASVIRVPKRSNSINGVELIGGAS